MGETKESVSAKDTKILVGLFGAVVGIGVAAFGYNYIKKKKRNASHTIDQSDPEEGREMKPLMKNGSEQKQTIEFNDERQGKTEDAKS